VVGKVEDLYKLNTEKDTNFCLNLQFEQVQLLCKAIEAILNYGIKRKKEENFISFFG
jgi:hypothetical protein